MGINCGGSGVGVPRRFFSDESTVQEIYVPHPTEGAHFIFHGALLKLGRGCSFLEDYAKSGGMGPSLGLWGCWAMCPKPFVALQQ